MIMSLNIVVKMVVPCENKCVVGQMKSRVKNKEVALRTVEHNVNLRKTEIVDEQSLINFCNGPHFKDYFLYIAS